MARLRWELKTVTMGRDFLKSVDTFSNGRVKHDASRSVLSSFHVTL